MAGAIVYTAWGVFRQASATLSDTARIRSRRSAQSRSTVPGVLGCHSIRTRGSEAEVYVDLHVQVDPRDHRRRRARIAEQVERALVEHSPIVVDAIVHLEPFDDYQQAKTAEESDAGLV